MSLSKSLLHKVEHSRAVIERERSRNPTDWAIAFSGGKDSMALLHLAGGESGQFWGKAFFLDPGTEGHPHKPAETIEFVKHVEGLWGVHLHVVTPKEPLECGVPCKEWKADMARRFPIVMGWKTVFVATRKDEHPAREWTPETTHKWEVRRVHPILAWTEEDVWEYTKHHGLPTNPLYERGFRSLGCEPQMSLVEPGEAERAGRSHDDMELTKRLHALGYFGGG